MRKKIFIFDESIRKLTVWKIEQCKCNEMEVIELVTDVSEWRMIKVKKRRVLVKK